MESVLITGGTGTLGRALVSRLLDENKVRRICIYSRGEHTQADMRYSLGDPDKCRWFIGDVRDYVRLRRAMGRCDTVIHAAALKRIEVGAYNPHEMTKTNVDGTVNVIEASQDAKVKNVVFISSDKAWQPVSPYGLSKALAESLIIAANNTVADDGPIFSACRYGNVWCSNGSVVPKWRALIRAGRDSVPVTDPDCTRFFMRKEEAVDLVLNTAANKKSGLAIPIDLPAYRLGDLAEAMNIKMDIIGLPSWEKKHEGMDFGVTSDIARRMTVDELRAELNG